MTKPQLPNMQQIVAKIESPVQIYCLLPRFLPTRSTSSTSATITTSTSFGLAFSHARVTSIKFAERYGVSQCSELVTSVANDRTQVR